MGKTLVIYIKFLRDVVYQKLLKSASVSRSYSKNNTGTVFLRHSVVVVCCQLTMNNIPFVVGEGVEGGFDVGEKKYDIEELSSILVMPGWHEFPLSLPGLPEKVVFPSLSNLL